MPVLSPDILLKTAIEVALADMRARPYLVEDCFSGLADDPMSKSEYGWREVARARDWFVNNNILVTLAFRIDKPVTPSINIVDQGAQEMVGERTALGDDRSTVETISPKGIRKTPQYVVPPHTPAAYDPVSGLVTLPKPYTTQNMAAGQFLVTPDGKAYEVRKLAGKSAYYIAPTPSLQLTGCWVAPSYSVWNLQREQTFMRHTYLLECVASSDSVQAEWLGAVVLYALQRYKEAFLEARGFELSSVVAHPLMSEGKYGADNVFSKNITLTGQAELSWIKFIAPRFEKTGEGILIMDGPRTPPGYQEQVDEQAWRMEADGEVGADGPTIDLETGEVAGIDPNDPLR